MQLHPPPETNANMNQTIHFSSSWRCAMFIPWLILLLCAGFGSALAQEPTPGADADAAATNVAPVELDGRILFSLRGISSYPAELRVEKVRENIIAAARNPAVSPDELRIVDAGDRRPFLAVTRC
jgi:hypothetical protein